MLFGVGRETHEDKKAELTTQWKAELLLTTQWEVQQDKWNCCLQLKGGSCEDKEAELLLRRNATPLKVSQ